MLESKLQAICVKYATEQGWIVLKIIASNMNGISDLILFKNGVTLFVEMKTEKGRVAPLQLYRQKQLQQQGFTYEICRSLEDFKKLITLKIREL